MEILRTVRSFPRLRKVFLGTGIAFLLYTVFGFLAAPPLLKYFLTKNLTAALHREVRIEKVRVNPYLLSVRMNGVTVGERGRQEDFISFDEAYGNFQILSLSRWGVILREIRLETPRVRITRNQEGRYNFSDLVEEFAAEEEPVPGSGPRPPKRAKRFSLNNIEIRNGSIDFFDGPKGIQHTVRGLQVSVPILSNFPYYVDRYVKPVLEAVVNDAPFSLQGQTKPFQDSLETSFDVDLRQLDIPFYLDYIPLRWNFRILSSFLDLKGKLSFIQYRDRDPALEFSGRIALDTVDVEDGDGKRFLRFPSLELSVASAELISRKIRLSQVILRSPEVEVRRDGAGKVNLQGLLPGQKKEGTPKATEAAGGEDDSGIGIEAETIRVENGKVSFSDLPGGKPFRTTLSPVDLEIINFHNAPQEKSGFRLALATESKETVTVSGDFTVSPPASEGIVEFGRVRPKKYSPYYASAVRFDVEDGVLDLSTRYRVARNGRETETILSGLTAALRSLRLKRRGEEGPFLAVPAADVAGTVLDLSQRKLLIGEFSTRNGAVLVNRPKGEGWNLAGLFPPKEPGGDTDSPGGETSGEEDPWRIEFGKIRFDEYAVQVEDGNGSQPVVLNADKIRIRVENLSTEPGKKGKASVSLALNGEGHVSAEGEIGLVPFSSRLAISGKTLDVVPFQPYFAERVNVVVTSGLFSAGGTLQVAASERNGWETTYAGEASLRGFASIDKEKADDFLTFASLDLGGMYVWHASTGSRVTIGQVGLTDFFSRIVVNPEGTLNVRGIVVDEGPEEEEGEGKKAAAPETREKEGADGTPVSGARVEIGRITLQGGTIHFSDRHIQPAYSANMNEVGGRVSGISSREGERADVELRGTLESQAPLEITGKINPFRETFFVDLAVSFRDMDISSLTPYSKRYIGYTISKGKLSLGLKYLIVKKRLDSENRVFLDQLALGERVESPDATKLPVKLAIALLKNRQGEIELDLPVTGNVDDPEFSVGGVILTILKNILIKAATSPFALLGAIFGGGEELSYLEFEYGKAAIPPPGEEKLASLEKVLFERPSLTMEIEGHVDVERDKEELRNIMFRRKLAAQKRKDLVRAGKVDIPLDGIEIAPAEYPQYLKKAYKEEKFPKPRNFLGFAKDLPPAEMEKLMYTHIEVTRDDLRLLAVERARNVRDRLLKTGKVEANRLFLIEPESLTPRDTETGKKSRVDFRIK